ncbi:MAG: outer membrane beta-barrel protein [Holosporaceae bacterium]|jgi:opacity protein-like surface antigen|nr:outer membrane beta-barrel protein [Holosporaceae bacterium]
MKKIILGSLVVFTFYAHADDESSNRTGVYGGISLEAISASSEYKMDFEVNQGNIIGGGGFVTHKQSSIKRLGYGVFLGFGGGEDYYCALEAGVVFHHFKLRKGFDGYQAMEITAANRTNDLNTSLEMACGNEYNIALKLGRYLDSSKKTRAYGLLGVAVRDMEVHYYYHPFAYNELTPGIAAQYPHRYRKRIWALVPGVGAEFRVCQNCSLGMEYRYKFYQSADSTKDLRNAPIAVGLYAGDCDLRPRNYKGKTGQHNLSFRVVFDI